MYPISRQVRASPRKAWIFDPRIWTLDEVRLFRETIQLFEPKILGYQRSWVFPLKKCDFRCSECIFINFSPEFHPFCRQALFFPAIYSSQHSIFGVLALKLLLWLQNLHCFIAHLHHKIVVERKFARPGAAARAADFSNASLYFLWRPTIFYRGLKYRWIPDFCQNPSTLIFHLKFSLISPHC